MSCYIVEREHIQYLLDAARSYRLTKHGHGPISWYNQTNQHRFELNDGNAEYWGQKLWDENKQSVTYRYPSCAEDELPGPVGESFVFKDRPQPWLEIDPVQVIKAAHCYRYQSCEHPSWEGSDAALFIEALISRAVHALPGYDEANWGPPSYKGPDAVTLSKLWRRGRA